MFYDPYDYVEYQRDMGYTPTTLFERSVGYGSGREDNVKAHAEFNRQVAALEENRERSV